MAKSKYEKYIEVLQSLTIYEDEAIAELQTENTELAGKISELEEEIEELKEEIEELKEEIDGLKSEMDELEADETEDYELRVFKAILKRYKREVMALLEEKFEVFGKDALLRHT